MKCVVCDKPTVTVAHAVVAPFIAELCGERGFLPSRLVSCQQCDLFFFTRRYSEGELSAIYSGYRNVNYLEVRKKWEPWYGSKINTAFEKDSPELQSRIRFMEDLINHSGQEEFSCSVDIGGDGGQFFTRHSVGSKFVIDISGRELEPDVERLSRLDDLPQNADLVLVCHLLEHVNDPVQLLHEVKDSMNASSFLYVEVPLDLPKVRDWHRSRRYQSYLNLVERARLLTIASDFLTGALRQFGLHVPRLGLVKQSEHINYFSRKSLVSLLEKSGFDVVAMADDPRASVGGLRLGKLGAVAKPKQ